MCSDQHVKYRMHRGFPSTSSLLLDYHIRFTSYPAAKRRKFSKFAITDMQKKPADHFFAVQRNFASLGTFVKVSIPVESIIPWSPPPLRLR